MDMFLAPLLIAALAYFLLAAFLGWLGGKMGL